MFEVSLNFRQRVCCIGGESTLFHVLNTHSKERLGNTGGLFCHSCEARKTKIRKTLLSSINSLVSKFLSPLA